MNPIPAFQRAIAPPVIFASCLFNIPGAQAQIDRPPIICLEMPKKPLHHQGQLVGKGRFKRGKSRLAHSDQRCVDRLMRTTLRSKGYSRRRGDKQEPRILVAAVVEGIQSARDEWVIDRSDWNQSRTEKGAAKPSAARSKNKLDSAMLSSRCWPAT